MFQHGCSSSTNKIKYTLITISSQFDDCCHRGRYAFLSTLIVQPLFLLPCMSDLINTETFLSSVILNFSFATLFDLILQSFQETCQILHAYFIPLWRSSSRQSLVLSMSTGVKTDIIDIGVAILCYKIKRSTLFTSIINHKQS